MNSNRTPNHSRIHRTVAAVLVGAAAVVIVGAFLVFQCLSFDEDGAHVVDRYGVLAMEAADSGKPEKTGQNTTSTVQAETPDEEPQDNVTAARAAMLSANALCDDDTIEELEQLAAEGTLDTVVVNIKDADGYLNIHVRTGVLEDADRLTEDTADDLEAAIGALRDAGVHVVGRIYCMHDQRATAQNADIAMQYQAGGTWLDYDSTRWLDITNRDVVKYLADIAESAAKAGCDEILLDEFTFPLRGHMDRIAFAEEPEEQASVLLEALEEIRDAAGADVVVSLTAGSADALTRLSETAESDGFPAGDVGALLAAADRVLVPVDDAADVEETVAEVQDMAADAVVVPVLDSVSAWMAYTGDAVLDAVYDTEDVLAVLSGEKSADEMDDGAQPDDETSDGADGEGRRHSDDTHDDADADDA